MDWEIRRFDDPEAFSSAVHEFLMQDEAVHNIALGVIETLESDANPYTGDNLMACAVSGEQVGGVVVRTPPYPGLLSLVADDGAAAALVDALMEAYPDIDVLNAPERVAPAALERFTELGFEWEVDVRQRLFRTSTVEYPEGVPGTWRRAEAADRERVADWFVRFKMEANETPEAEARDKTRDQVETYVGEGMVYLWTVDGEPVSMAGYAGHTPNGVRVGYVYTPPAHRENGYASAVTAVATGQALEAGCEYCYLYTDLANETTNRIYPALGYEPVADQNHYALTPPADAR